MSISSNEDDSDSVEKRKVTTVNQGILDVVTSQQDGEGDDVADARIGKEAKVFGNSVVNEKGDRGRSPLKVVGESFAWIQGGAVQKEGELAGSFDFLLLGPWTCNGLWLCISNRIH